MNSTILLGDCLDRIKELESNSIDAVVTDPPYGLSFMGKKWDYDVPSEDIWRECLRVLKPGGHLLAFAGTRTQHRMAVRIEDAGFEIRDMIAWVYGSGFPKSLDVSKAIDKAAGETVETSYVPNYKNNDYGRGLGGGKTDNSFVPATEAAKQWQGWGTALKPALEPITVARKPFSGTVAANVLAHGTGALNVDGCRIPHTGSENMMAKQAPSKSTFSAAASDWTTSTYKDGGRWPANLIHDGSEEVMELFPVTTSGRFAKRKTTFCGDNGGTWNSVPTDCEVSGCQGGDTGSAARFFKECRRDEPTMDETCNGCIMLSGCSQRIWKQCAEDAQRIYYCAKASKRDRDAGCEGFSLAKTNDGRKVDADNAYQRGATLRANTHPTVKPTDLMRYLVRLVTPPGGVVLDPFCGSGSTGKACALEGFQFIGIEREAEYVEIAKARIAAVSAVEEKSEKIEQFALAL